MENRETDQREPKRKRGKEAMKNYSKEENEAECEISAVNWLKKGDCLLPFEGKPYDKPYEVVSAATRNMTMGGLKMSVIVRKRYWESLSKVARRAQVSLWVGDEALMSDGKIDWDKVDLEVEILDPSGETHYVLTEDNFPTDELCKYVRKPEERMCAVHNEGDLYYSQSVADAYRLEVDMKGVVEYALGEMWRVLMPEIGGWWPPQSETPTDCGS